MNWLFLGLISALFAAIQFSLKSRLAQDKRLDSIIGFFTYLAASIFLYIFYFLFKGNILDFSALSGKFWLMIGIHCILEVIAILALFRAFRLADLSYLMPLLAVSSISVIIPAWIFFGEKVSIIGFFGIILAISGAILIDYGEKQNKEKKGKKQAKLMLLIVLLAWSFTPILRKEAIILSSAASTAIILHFLIALTFIIPFFLRKEYKIISEKEWRLPKYFYLGLLAISISAAIAHLSNYLALANGLVAYAMALKEITPIFVFIIAFFLFKEKNNLWKKLIATILAVVGTILISL
ncbi:MAG: EamA family transporter [Patescibacteria group bacterium]